MTGWARIAVLCIIALLVMLAIWGWSRPSTVISVPPAPAPRTEFVTSPPPAAVCPPTPVCPVSASAPPPAPTADPIIRERKRFGRNDKNDDGIVNQTEYLTSRRRSFDKMDANGDGLVNFSEYSVKQRERFARSDCDRTGTLNPDEFQSTATRKDAPEPNC